MLSRPRLANSEIKSRCRIGSKKLLTFSCWWNAIREMSSFTNSICSCSFHDSNFLMQCCLSSELSAEFREIGDMTIGEKLIATQSFGIRRVAPVFGVICRGEGKMSSFKSRRSMSISSSINCGGVFILSVK